MQLTWCFCFAASPLLAGEKTAPKLTDEQKLAIILNGVNEFPRADRMRQFAKEGSIDAVGRLVTIGKSVYFKSADQSYIPEGKRFPYPELLLELHLTETHAYQPFMEHEFVKNRNVLYDGPVRIKGNWAYEAPYHIFGLVWVDEASKAPTYPDVDWGPWMEKRNTPLQTSFDSQP
ncbi:hypothetical protein M4951_14850 [Blastopirellula sp. J2-11]|uniref:hypothetical protein n=1 Tax=Blastopirellula sp. J2-11 TaxID=2943192 RepID=UPI0021C9A644|nr:hypothetical protein [Blastopirellula sp. J2-11]UUO04666.1 hypothetical protein M4951_14850 [Blastopirellula sp. J2-11]